MKGDHAFLFRAERERRRRAREGEEKEKGKEIKGTLFSITSKRICVTKNDSQMT